MSIETRFDFFALIILLGVFQGFFLGYFLLRKTSRQFKRNIFLGYVIIGLSLVILEILLNYTGVITHVIFIDNFAEPLNFAIAPLFYLYIWYGLFPNRQAREWPHFVIFIFYFFYCWFYYLQPSEFKYNSFLWSYHPHLFPDNNSAPFNPDPLYIRHYINELTVLHFLTYQIMGVRLLSMEYKRRGLSLFTLSGNELSPYRNFAFHFIVAAIILIIVKTLIGRDLGDVFVAGYIALMLYVTSFMIVGKSNFFIEQEKQGFEKYKKSALEENQKDAIKTKLEALMNEKYYCGNLVSMADMAERIGETPHRVSQVINEKYGMNFFNWLAQYRVNEAKKILTGADAKKYKIEEIAEMVGYNSKATFNKTFKNITGLTPSDYRDQY